MKTPVVETKGAGTGNMRAKKLSKGGHKASGNYQKEVNDFLSDFQAREGISSPTPLGKESLKRYLHYRIMADMRFSEPNANGSSIRRWLAKNIDRKVGADLLKIKEGPMAVSPQAEVHILSLKELNLLFVYSLKDMHGLILRLIYSLGLRVKEAIDLKVNDIDLERRTIGLNRSGSSLGRYLRLPGQLIPSLESFIADRKPEDYIFSLRRDSANSSRRPISPRTIQLYLNRLCQRIGIKTITPQTLRDNYAIYMLRRGVASKVIMRQMGLASSSSVQRYARYISETDLELPSPLNDCSLILPD